MEWNIHVTEVAQFKQGRKVMIPEVDSLWRENGYVTEVVSLMEGA